MYYSIVEKETGIMPHGHSNYSDHQDRPLHESLVYVPLNTELVKLLVSTDPTDHVDLRPVDFTKSYWDFKKSEWMLTYISFPSVDPIEECLKLRQSLVNDATRKLAIVDLPTTLKQKLTDYITHVSDIEVTSDNVQAIVWPDVPF